MARIMAALLCIFSIASRAQTTPGVPRTLKVPEGIIVCYACKNKVSAYVPEPEVYRRRNFPGGRVQGTANIEVTYDEGFSQAARRAFQKAVDIWNTLLTSPVTIKINATWRPLDPGVLGSCGATDYYINFPGAPRLNTWYPVALANKLANRDMNGNDYEMVANFSNSMPWHYDPDTRAPSGKYDLVSVVMHEIGHGLGIFSAFEVWGNQGQIRNGFQGYPCAYDLCLETGSHSLIGFTSPSSQLGTALTGNSLFFNSASVLRLNTTKGQVYAPGEYTPGSSISHNDEAAYPSGHTNSLMTPQIGDAETIHNPGPVTLGELSDMGWTNPILAHTPLVNMESTPADLQVICTLRSGDSDYAPRTNTLSLNYKANSGNLVTVVMTPAGRPNEYQATIPKPASSQPVNYAYYFSVSDSRDRNFSWPGKTPTPGSANSLQTYYKFKAGPDTQGPNITHTPITAIKKATATLKLEATITDDFDIQGGVVEWMVNTTIKTSVNLTPVSDSVYTASLPLTGLTLSPRDVIKYRITATDNSISHLSTSLPAANHYYTVKVVGYESAQESYTNNFDSLNADDFFGDFTIARADDFDNGAIHSPHPYAQAKTMKKGFLNFSYELLKPIKVKEGMGIINFDEIVLVEPGESGSVYGSHYFYDYVIVEGSADKGNTWQAVADGWDSGEKVEWQQTWSSQKQGTNSTARGTPALFHTRSLSLLNTFRPNDEVVLRFRLHSDPEAAGWGWAIDNLAIQDSVQNTVQNTDKSIILHSHLDYVMNTIEVVRLQVQVLDTQAIRTLSFKVKLNEQEEVTHAVDLSNKSQNTYQVEVPYPAGTLKKGDYINYRIEATDSLNFTTSLPSTGYYRIEVLDLSEPVINYPDITTDKFFGNFITTTQTTIETAHPYAAGFGADYQSEFSAILSKPVKLEAKRPDFTFREILLPGENDYVQVEGSKDGIAWKSLSDQYTTAATDLRTVSFFKDNEFKEGDVILLRFRLSSDKTGTGWGWEISDLQFNEVPATINKDILLHNHLDYVMNTTEVVRLQVQVLDTQAIRTLSVKVKLNEQEEVTHSVDLSNKNQNTYQVEVPYPAGDLKKGDYINYRIEATGSPNFTTSLPPTGYYRIEVLDLCEPVISYSDITTDKFFGNFITTTQTTIETEHPYETGFGADYQTSFSAILSKPVKLEAKRPDFTFKEKLLPGANDYVQVEGSKDGIAWKSLSDPYTTEAADLRTVSFFKDNEYKEGDVILLRFRLSSDQTGAGWGWEISDLQFPENAVTAIEEKKEFSLFPNPVKEGEITVWVNAVNDFSAEVNDVYGRQILTRLFPGGTKEIKLSTDNLSPGFYLLSLREGGKRRTLRFVKL